MTAEQERNHGRSERDDQSLAKLKLVYFDVLDQVVPAKVLGGVVADDYCPFRAWTIGCFAEGRGGTIAEVDVADGGASGQIAEHLQPDEEAQREPTAFAGDDVTVTVPPGVVLAADQREFRAADLPR